jgi:hypothetical protein
MVSSLRRVAAGYRAMAAAASAHNGASFNSAGNEVKAGMSALASAFAELQKAGYSLG